VRRVQRLNPAAKQGQDELFAMWRHHGFVTNSTLSAVAANEIHRDHALIEQVIAELKDGPLAHAPSGRFTANAAWPWPALRSTFFARPARPPRSGTPRLDGPPCAAT